MKKNARTNGTSLIITLHTMIYEKLDNSRIYKSITLTVINNLKLKIKSFLSLYKFSFFAPSNICHYFMIL